MARKTRHATPIITVETPKFFSLTKIASLHARVPVPPIERVLKIVTLKNFDEVVRPSSPKEPLVTHSALFGYEVDFVCSTRGYSEKAVAIDTNRWWQ